MNVRVLSNLLLISVYATPFLSTTLNMVYVSGVSSVFNWIQRILCMLILLTSNRKEKKTGKGYHNILIFFVVYMTFVIGYLLENRIPMEQSLGIPDNWRQFLLISTSLFLLMLCAPIVSKNANCKILSKFIVILTTFASVLYFTRIDYKLYLMQFGTSDIIDLGIIHPFVLSTYGSIGFFAAFSVKNDWSRFNIVNKIIFYAAIILTAIIVIVATKRGPILYLILTMLIYFFYQNRISKRTFIKLAIVTLFFLLFGNDIIMFLSDVFPEIFGRFAQTMEHGGSGRFGDDESLYSLAIEQILQEPLWGSHMRILNFGPFYGAYPHNFFLEVAMTMGIPLAMIFMLIILRTFQVSCKSLKINNNIVLFLLITVYSFLLMMTTGSPLLNVNFWFGLCLLSTYQIIKENIK